MCKFTESEKREREALQNVIDSESSMTLMRMSEIGSYEDWDGLITRDKQFEMVEVKIRKIKHDDYPTAYLELDKVNRLIESCKEYPTMRPVGYFFYEDLTLLIVDLLSYHTIELNIPMPKTTDGDSTMILKDVCAYPIENATKITLKKEENEWGF